MKYSIHCNKRHQGDRGVKTMMITQSIHPVHMQPLAIHHSALRPTSVDDSFPCHLVDDTEAIGP